MCNVCCLYVLHTIQIDSQIILKMHLFYEKNFGARNQKMIGNFFLKNKIKIMHLDCVRKR